MSNTTAPPDSLSEPPPPPASNTSPPEPAAPSPPAPPTPSNLTPPPQSPPPSSPPPSPPPSSPPPSPPQSPPESSNSPPPNSGSSPPSPPPAVNSPPPGSQTPESSPPPKSNPSPPPPKNSSHPPSSPPPQSPSPSSQGPPVAGSPPPAPPQLSPPPPGIPTSSQGSTPPPSEFVSPPPGQSTPPPVPEGAVPSSPPQTLSPPPVSPAFYNAPPATPSNHTPSNGISPTSSTSISPPSSSLPPTNTLSSQPIDPKVIGGGVAGVVIIAFVALFFLFSRKRKKRSAVFATQYMPPNSFSSKSDGYYLSNSGPADAFYTQSQHSLHGIGNSYGSQRGNMYNQGPPDSNGIGGAKSWFSYEEVMEITNGFSHQNIIGEGGFGCVYKGSLSDGKVVAVKQLKKGSGQGEREFRAEVEIISRVHHRYLVSLVGYCISESQRLLIYEFVPNQTLEHHLHDKGMPVLEWSKRTKIALGAARGLAYLHEDCHPKIIHRDIKSANILLDEAFEAQVADFGLAKLTDNTNTHVSTRVMGTFGYMAPEYASSGKLSDRSDVFSFGVVLLELVTGRKPVDPTQPLGDESLVEWARPRFARALDTRDFSEIVDARLGQHYVESEMFRMIEAAAACVRHSAPKRPRMVQVARALDNEDETADLSNGVKYGQSTIYESGQYNQDIARFRRMAFGSGDSKEFDTYSGEYTSKELTPGLTNSWKSGDTSSEFPSSESETRAMNVQRADGERRFR